METQMHFWSSILHLSLTPQVITLTRCLRVVSNQSENACSWLDILIRFTKHLTSHFLVDRIILWAWADGKVWIILKTTQCTFLLCDLTAQWYSNRIACTRLADIVGGGHPVSLELEQLWSYLAKRQWKFNGGSLHSEVVHCSTTFRQLLISC